MLGIVVPRGPVEPKVTVKVAVYWECADISGCVIRVIGISFSLEDWVVEYGCIQMESYLAYLPKDLVNELIRLGANWPSYLERLPPELREEIESYYAGITLTLIGRGRTAEGWGGRNDIVELHLTTPRGRYLITTPERFVHQYNWYHRALPGTPYGLIAIGRYGLSLLNGEADVIEEFTPAQIVAIDRQLGAIRDYLITH